MNVPSLTTSIQAAAAALLLSACLDSAAVPAAPTPSDSPLAGFQSELLDLAFDAASALPLNPHVKNRSLAQEEAVTAGLALGQPQRALTWIPQIENWRRGVCYADAAHHLAQHGDLESAERCLELARAVAADPAAQDGQAWRGDRIRAKIARARFGMGQIEQAEAAAVGVAASELGELSAARAERADEADFDAYLASLGATVATLNFDLVRSALMDCAHLFGRFYGDATRRAQAEEGIKSSWGHMPLLVRIELLRLLTEQALAQGDPAKARALVDEAQAMLASETWTPEDEIRQRSLLAALRHRAGDAANARAQADSALGLYEVERVRIVDVDRAGALLPLAQAYETMGDPAAALAVYKLAVAAAVTNPNSRPRAMDLSAICASMALGATEPDAELWESLRAARTSLGDPW